ncbi:MAG: hypothetical protein DI538_05825 [Azospira oryzae]|jgi:hypothetical protein|nr:hypothetical protein [Cytophaga sp.]PZR39858.1 MAG: hypothetical protein DI538_05825 [Azospira oryzae]
MQAFRTILIVLFAFLFIFSVKAQVKEESFGTDPVKSIHLFPNPAVEYLSVRFETPQAKTVKFALHNIIGNEIAVESEIQDEYEIHLKVKDLPTGYYLLTVREGASNQRSTFKFLKR